ncbi:hypothetical protein GW17_00045456 [Ensete ventricosum]|nr:hypothetical protein GW17_00045456 [Ensete ventricosum]
MITSHLDATDGRSSVWEEFASCFLKILTSSVADYEDRVSANGQGGSAAIISSNKIPRVFTEGQARESWKVRCRWWLTRHFGKNVYLQDMQYSKLSNELYGDRKLLATKAASASHIYGPNFEYVMAYLSMGEAHRRITDYLSRFSDAVSSQDAAALSPLLAVSSNSASLQSLADALNVFQVLHHTLHSCRPPRFLSFGS